MEKITHNELKGIQCRFGDFKVVFYTVGGHGAEGTLIYIALSKCKNESITHLRKQLMMLHCFVISAGTNKIVKSF